MIVPKIDMHVHTTTYELRQPPFDPKDPLNVFVTPENLFKDFYSKVNVDHALILPMVSPEGGQFAPQSPREAYLIAADDPKRFSWFCNVDPRMRFNDPKIDFSYILGYYKEMGAKGVGEMVANLQIDDPRMYNLFKYCEMFDLPLLFHMSLSEGGDYGMVDSLGLPKLEQALKDFPKLKFIGHSQAFWAHMSGDIDAEGTRGYPTGKIVPGGRVEELMSRYENLYCDFSAGSGFNSLSRDPEYAYQFIEKFQDRCFYGTDICSNRNITSNMLNLSFFLDDAVESGKISQKAYEKVSRRNAEKMLGLK